MSHCQNSLSYLSWKKVWFFFCGGLSPHGFVLIQVMEERICARKGKKGKRWKERTEEEKRKRQERGKEKRRKGKGKKEERKRKEGKRKEWGSNVSHSGSICGPGPKHKFEQMGIAKVSLGPGVLSFSPLLHLCFNSTFCKLRCWKQETLLEENTCKSLRRV